MLNKNSPRHISGLLLLSLVVLGISACGEDNNNNDNNNTTNNNETQCPVAADIGFPTLSDEEIVQVVMTVNMGEIQQGQLAQQQATNTEVRQFADQMVQEHTTANQELQARLQTLGITPRESPLSQQLAAESNQILTILRSDVGSAAFDLAYMDVQVSLHAKTLFLMDKVLQPQIQRAELREFARMGRGMVQEHLNTAVPIQQDLSPSP
ncbi:DUF4142 domain-containing protein [Archangium lipolyticum]|uniref:DUF4142 domain-containing protein n=1 Tax=Archangium lipolyticum TaxID=2970465 RepID=UPI002149F455|nr:DUF4142 domain-containing protein [Archangium lipolyticum]